MRDNKPQIFLTIPVFPNSGKSDKKARYGVTRQLWKGTGDVLSRLSNSASALLARTPASQHGLRALALVVTAVGCVLVLIGLTGLFTAHGEAERSAPAAPTELLVPATGATWVPADARSAGSERPDGQTERAERAAVLRAGDTSGGAVTYLKFEVTELEHAVTAATLHLTGAGERLPELVELVQVPDTGWLPEALTWQTAPLFGSEVRTAHPQPDRPELVFDVTDLVTGPGTYAFAVTVPPDHGHAAFVGPGAGAGEPQLRLSWADPGDPAEPPGPAAAPGGAGTGDGAALPGVNPGCLGAVPPVAAGTDAGDGSGEGTGTGSGCVVGESLVPDCGVLWGVAPSGHTGAPRTEALHEFEQDTGRKQDIYHAYHRADSLFPTDEEVAIAEQGRILFLNWKPRDWSWAEIAAGHPAVDSYLDRLAEHIRSTYTDQFFFTIHHEPENDVNPRPGSGWEATDYAAMYRHVIERLRGAGVENLVTVMNYLAYVPWTSQPWYPELYPGDDVVDWIAWNAYAYSEPGYGFGDFGELMNRTSAQHPDWPGFYNWSTAQFPDKPFMLGEWGVWYSEDNPGHMAEFFESVGRQLPLFPRIRAMVYFDTPSDQRDRDSRPQLTQEGLEAYRTLGTRPYFQVDLRLLPDRAGR